VCLCLFFRGMQYIYIYICIGGQNVCMVGRWYDFNTSSMFVLCVCMCEIYHYTIYNPPKQKNSISTKFIQQQNITNPPTNNYISFFYDFTISNDADCKYLIISSSTIFSIHCLVVGKFNLSKANSPTVTSTEYSLIYSHS
jgi:hypothetical protein